MARQKIEPILLPRTSKREHLIGRVGTTREFLAAHEPLIPAQMAHYREVLSTCTADQVWDACLTWIRADKGRAARTDELLDLIYGDGPRPEPGWTPPATREEKYELIVALGSAGTRKT